MTDKNKQSASYASLKGFHRAVPIVLIALSVYLTLSFIIKDMGIIGNAISGFLLGLFSYGAYAFPLLMILHAILYPSDLEEKRLVKRVIFSLVAITSIAALGYVISYWNGEPAFNLASYYRDAVNGTGGGFIGGFIAFCLVRAFSKVGLIIIVTAVFAVYISYFFAKGESGLVKAMLMIVKVLFVLFEIVVETVIDLFKKIKSSKDAKTMRQSEQKNIELTDDDFFGVDNGMKKLDIPDLGIRETRTKESAETNPTLQDKIFYKSGVSQEEAEEMEEREMRERAAEMFAAEQAARMAKDGKKAPAEQKERRRIINVSYGNLEDEVIKPAENEPIVIEPVEEPEKKEAPVQAPFVSDARADSVFTRDFDPFSLVMAEELASKPSSRSLLDEKPAAKATIKEDISEITEEDIERARRLDDFERRKAAFLTSTRTVPTATPVENDGAFTGTQKNVDFREHASERVEDITDDSFVSADAEKTVELPKAEPARYTSIGYGESITEPETEATAFTVPETIYFHQEPTEKTEYVIVSTTPDDSAYEPTTANADESYSAEAETSTFTMSAPTEETASESVKAEDSIMPLFQSPVTDPEEYVAQKSEQIAAAAAIPTLTFTEPKADEPDEDLPSLEEMISSPSYAREPQQAAAPNYASEPLHAHTERATTFREEIKEESAPAYIEEPSITLLERNTIVAEEQKTAAAPTYTEEPAVTLFERASTTAEELEAESAPSYIEERAVPAAEHHTAEEPKVESPAYEKERVTPAYEHRAPEYAYQNPPAPAYGYPTQPQTVYGYPTQPQGYGYPPQAAPAYGYPPQPMPGYGYPAQPAYAYPAQPAPGYGYPAQPAPAYQYPSEPTATYAPPAQTAPEAPKAPVYEAPAAKEEPIAEAQNPIPTVTTVTEAPAYTAPVQTEATAYVTPTQTEAPAYTTPEMTNAPSSAQCNSGSAYLTIAENDDNDEVYTPKFKEYDPTSSVIETDGDSSDNEVNDQPITLTIERSFISDDNDKENDDEVESIINAVLDDPDENEPDEDISNPEEIEAEDGEFNTVEIPPEERNPVVSEYRNMFAALADEGEEEEESSDNHELISPDEAPDVIDGVEYREIEDDEPPFDANVTIQEEQPKKEAAPAPKKKKPSYANYKFPPIDFLGLDEAVDDDTSEITENTNILIDTLASFNVTASIKGVARGPRITRYEVVPARGVKVQSITSLFNDIRLNLAKEGVRMEAPIPGKAAVGFEIPNERPKIVRLRELLECEEFIGAKSKTFVSIGKDVAGNPVFGDIAKYPHALICGATGMGKSVCINSILVSMLYKARPDEVKLIMVDPKKVEFRIYSGIPHLLIPVITEAKQAAGALMWAVEEMERRYELIEKFAVRNIEAYNAKVADDPSLGETLPKIVIVIDELADLMMQVRDPVEDLIMRIAQKARAAGIHLLIGTQRPSVQIITGAIKANIPSRFSCKVTSQVDSRTIFDMAGAEKLLNRGDMLYWPQDRADALRVQCAFVSDSEVESIMEFLKQNSSGDQYDDDVMAEINKAAQKCGKKKDGGVTAEDVGDDDQDYGYYSDQRFLDAVDLAIRSGKVSTSLLQRKLSIGYGKAAKYIDAMEDIGVVSEPQGQKPREVLITMDEWREKLSRVDLG